MESSTKLLSNKYLKKGHPFDEVVKHDAEIIEKAGLTHKQIADSLEKVLSCFNWFVVDHWVEKKKLIQPINSVLSVYGEMYLGKEYFPLDENITSSTDYFIHGIPNGNKAEHNPDEPTLVSEMLPEIIEGYHFFEGDVDYGIKPE